MYSLGNEWVQNVVRYKFIPDNPDDPCSTIEIFFADPEFTVQIG